MTQQACKCGAFTLASDELRTHDGHSRDGCVAGDEPKAPPSLAALVEQQEGQQGQGRDSESARRWRYRSFGDEAAPQRIAALEAGIRDVLAEADVGTLTTGEVVEYLCQDCTRDPATGAHEDGCIWGMLVALLPSEPAAGPPAAAALATSREGLDLTELRRLLMDLGPLAREKFLEAGEATEGGWEAVLHRIDAALASLDRAAQEQQGSKNES